MAHGCSPYNDRRSTASLQSHSPALKLHPTVDKMETATSEQTVTTCDSSHDQKSHYQDEHNVSPKKAKNKRQAEEERKTNLLFPGAVD